MLRKLPGAPLIVSVGAMSALVVLGAIGMRDDKNQLLAQQDQPKGAPPGFGPGGPGGPPPGFGPGMFLAPQILEASDADKDGKLSPEEAGRAASKFVRDADKAKAGGLDRDALAQAINQRMGPPPGFGPDDEDGPPSGPPPGFGPGMFLAPRVLQEADANKDGKLSPEEAAKAAESLVKDADTAKTGGLDRAALASMVNRRFGPPGGMGGPGGPMGQEKKLVKTFDKDGDGRLNASERTAARESVKKERGNGGPMGFGPPPGFGKGEVVAAKPGPHVEPSEVKTYAETPLYDPNVVRTLFLDFEGKDWEAEMADFYKSDVEIPASLVVDGKKYPGVGVHFRGMSSFFAVRPGQKRSLNVSIDFTDAKQRLLGYKTLNLLNSHEDPTFLHSVLYFDVARQYIPAPKANFVRVVINGESWGLYVNAQQYDKTFLAENYPSSKGTRWKVPGSPGGEGGLDYIGDDIEQYKRRYQIKTGDDDKAWNALIDLCKTLSRTPTDQLEAALKPKLDIEGALWFLALDDALINGDGYWVRASDYSIYRDDKGVFHMIPHDANETFGPPMGPPGFGPGGPGGGRGGPGGPGGGPGMMGPGPRGVDLDPLVGMDDTRKPLRSRLLAVPALRARYLEHVRTIAEKDLDWKTLGPKVARYRALIEKEVEADTRKLTSYTGFQRTLAEVPPAETAKRGRPSMSLKAFADQRRAFLLNHEPKAAP